MRFRRQVGVFFLVPRSVSEPPLEGRLIMSHENKLPPFYLQILICDKEFVIFLKSKTDSKGVRNVPLYEEEKNYISILYK